MSCIVPLTYKAGLDFPDGQGQQCCYCLTGFVLVVCVHSTPYEHVRITPGWLVNMYKCGR